jgi:hypothetical protein
MEYSYTDIEARIRLAQKMRSEALGEILAAGYSKAVQFFKGLIQHKPHQAAVATRSSPAHIY